MVPINVNIKRVREDAKIPCYATSGAAACDLVACIDEPIVIEKFAHVSLPTGIAISPTRDDVVALVFSRSGMGCKHGICLSNGVGVIDSDYRGEIKVSLFNGGAEDYTVNPGDRIAQLMFVPVLAAAFTEVKSLDETNRGDGGFGSTGK